MGNVEVHGKAPGVEIQLVNPVKIIKSPNMRGFSHGYEMAGVHMVSAPMIQLKITWNGT